MPWILFSGYVYPFIDTVQYKCGDIFLLLLLCTFPISPSASLPCLVLCVQVVDLMQHPTCRLAPDHAHFIPFKNLTEPSSSPGCRHTSHKKQFLPSPRLQRSLVWTNMTAHHQDSSLLLWDKSWHPRRTLQALMRILISKEYR